MADVIGTSEALTGVERDMAKAYVQVHSRKINAHLKAAQGSASARTELELALLEAKGVVAALERLLVVDTSKSQEQVSLHKSPANHQINPV